MERKDISHDFKIIPVVRKVSLNKINEAKEDVKYWLTRPAQERLAAVTFLVFQSLPEGARLDKTVIRKKRLRHI